MKNAILRIPARRLGLLFLVTLVMMSFTGCSREETSSSSSPVIDASAEGSPSSQDTGWFSRLTGYPGRLASTRQELEVARAAAAEAERDAQAMRVLLDTQRDTTEKVGKSRSFWRVASTVLVALAIVAIFVGAGIGSFARHAHQQQQASSTDAHAPSA